MTALATIHSLVTWRPPLRRNASLFGPEVRNAYGHLMAREGAASRPSTVARGVTHLDCAPYDAPTADETLRASQFASDTVGHLLEQQPAHRARIDAVFSTQCTLDQQILASTCLRICHEHVPNARLARNFGQMGTAGALTALKLASMELDGRADDLLVCVAACDKWIAPFYRQIPNVAVFADAAAACLVGPSSGQGVARIEALQASVRAFDGDLWTAPSDQLREHIVEHAVAMVRAVVGDGPTPFLAGDYYLADVSKAVSARTGLSLLPGHADRMAQAQIHHSSASPMFGLSESLEAAAAMAKPLHVVIWTVSIAGSAGAMRLICNPVSRHRNGVWLLPEEDPTAQPTGIQH